MFRRADAATENLNTNPKARVSESMSMTKLSCPWLLRVAAAVLLTRLTCEGSRSRHMRSRLSPLCVQPPGPATQGELFAVEKVNRATQRTHLHDS